MRVVPRSDLPIKVMIPGKGILQDPIKVVDVSVGGIAVLRNSSFASAAVGDLLKLRVSFAAYGTHEVQAEVRRNDGVTVGLQFVEAPSEMLTTATQYVSELLERGAAA